MFGNMFGNMFSNMFSNMFLGRQPCQGEKFLLGSRDGVSPWNFEEPSHIDAAVRLFTLWRCSPPLYTLTRLSPPLHLDAAVPPLHLDAAVRPFTHWHGCPPLHTLTQLSAPSHFDAAVRTFTNWRSSPPLHNLTRLSTLSHIDAAVRPFTTWRNCPPLHTLTLLSTPSHLDAAVRPRIFYWILLLRRHIKILQDDRDRNNIYFIIDNIYATDCLQLCHLCLSLPLVISCTKTFQSASVPIPKSQENDYGCLWRGTNLLKLLPTTQYHKSHWPWTAKVPVSTWHHSLALNFAWFVWVLGTLEGSCDSSLGHDPGSE